VKLGIVSDVHGNIEGLRLALDQLGDVDEVLCAGDAFYQFRFSNDVIALLRERSARYVLGNHERVFLSPAGQAARERDNVDAEHLAYVAEQPYRIDTRVNGRKLTMVHGSPHEPYDEYLYPNSRNLAKLAGIDADYIILGHTHYHMAVRVGDALVINPGSAGEPRDHRNGFRLSAAVLDTTTGDVAFHHYDDPTRPRIDPAVVPHATSHLHKEEHPLSNEPFWL
jgi:putative phosphoesterase